MSEKQDISAYVLAGGKSSRMGQDKGLIEIDGKPMALRTSELLTSLGFQPTIIAHGEGYQDWGYPVISDLIPGKGPMGGLHTALQHSKSDNVLLVSCDTPFLPKEAIQSLIKAMDGQQAVVAEINGRMNPLMGIYSSDLREKVKQNLEQDRLKMQDFIRDCLFTTVSMEELVKNNPQAFLNINTPEDLKNSIELWKKH